MERFDGALVGGRWKLGRKLGTGGQGSTYLARDAASPEERIVCVKEYRLSKESGWKKYNLFQREVEVLGRLQHAGVPRFVATLEGDPPGMFYLVMERVPGRTLAELAAERRFGEPELRDIAVRLLDVLAYLHAHEPPVIHRDLKPANVVVDTDGGLHLVDFGGVRNALREGGGSTVVGTFGYMAPEQLHGQAMAATDLYGLGATLVALAGGIEPEDVPRKGLRIDLQKHLKEAGLGADFVRFLERLTQPDPEQRPASATDALALLGDPDKLLAKIHPEPEHDDYSLDELPAAARSFFHALITVAGSAGWMGIALMQRVFMPIIWLCANALADEQQKPKLASWRQQVDRGLAEGRGEMRKLIKRADTKKLPR